VLKCRHSGPAPARRHRRLGLAQPLEGSTPRYRAALLRFNPAPPTACADSPPLNPTPPIRAAPFQPRAAPDARAGRRLAFSTIAVLRGAAQGPEVSAAASGGGPAHLGHAQSLGVVPPSSRWRRPGAAPRASGCRAEASGLAVSTAQMRRNSRTKLDAGWASSSAQLPRCTMRPASSTAIWRPRACASAASWVTTIVGRASRSR